jgi:cell division protein FtsB
MARMISDPAGSDAVPATSPGRRPLRSAQETRDRRRRHLTIGLSLALCALLVNSIVGENGYLATLRYRAEQAELMAAVAALRLENQRLQQERRRLVEDPTALEEAARSSLGLVRPGETLVIYRTTRPGSTPPAR